MLHSPPYLNKGTRECGILFSFQTERRKNAAFFFLFKIFDLRMLHSGI